MKLPKKEIIFLFGNLSFFALLKGMRGDEKMEVTSVAVIVFGIVSIVAIICGRVARLRFWEVVIDFRPPSADKVGSVEDTSGDDESHYDKQSGIDQLERVKKRVWDKDEISKLIKECHREYPE